MQLSEVYAVPCQLYVLTGADKSGRACISQMLGQPQQLQSSSGSTAKTAMRME